MQNTKSHIDDQEFLSATHFQEVQCDDWTILIGKPRFKWPNIYKTHKDCDDWMGRTCHEAISRVQEFNGLVQKWKEDTIFTSSITQMAIHSSYQRIIGMGQPAIPLILRELQENPSHWFWALEAITGENPAQSVTTFDEGVQAWLKWGRTKGHIR